MSIRYLIPFCRFIAIAGLVLVPVWQGLAQESKPELQIATGHADKSSGQMVIAEEKLLITSAGDGEIKVWDLVTGKVLKNWSMPQVAGLPLYVKDPGLLIFNVGRYIEIYRTSDLSKVTSIKRDRTDTPCYDPSTNRVFFTQPTTEGMRVLEYEIGTPYLERRALLPNPPNVEINRTVPQLNATRIVPLGDGRLLFELGHNRGSAILDSNDWSKVEMRPDEKRRFELGRPGELISMEKRRAVEVVDSHTFALLRSAEMTKADPTDTGILFFNGFTAAKPGLPEQIVIQGGRYVRFLDPKTLQVTRQLDMKKDFPSLKGYLADLDLFQGDEWLLTTPSGLYVVNLRDPRVVQTLGVKTLPAARLVAAPEGFRFFVTNGKTRTSRRVDFTNEGVNLTAFDENPVNMKYSPDGRLVAFQHPGERIVRLSSIADFPRKYRQFNRTKEVPLPDQANFVFSPDGRFLAVLSDRTTHIYEVATGRLVLEPEMAARESSLHSREGFGVFSPDGNTFVHNISLKGEGIYAKGWIRAYDLTTATQLWEKPSTNLVLCYSPDGGQIFTLNDQKHYIHGFDAASGEEVSRRGFAAGPEPIVHWSISADGTRFLYAKGRDINVLALPSLERISFHLHGSPVEYAAFFGNNNYFATLSADGHIRLWKSGNAFPLATLVLFENGKDWCLYTPDFQFQSSPGGMKEVYFVKGRSIIPLESLFEQFFTPGLAPRLLAGETLQPAIDVAKIKMPPSITLALDTGTRGLSVEDDIAVVKSTESQVKIAVNAVSTDTAIAEIRLYHNGKLVQATTRGLFVEDDPEAFTEKRTFPLTLQPGENVFRAVAINAQRVESLPAELVIKFVPPGTGPVVVAGGGGGLQLHLVIVGLNKYRNPRFNLNYAVADATAVREHIEKRAGDIFTKINTQVIFDDQAVKPAIVAAFQKVAATAGPRDAFIFYYAGHGVMSEAAKPFFYLVPYDVTQMYGADEKLETAAISSLELQELSRLIPAQKQLFILDACQSAGALEAIAVRGAAEQKAIAQLARSSGTHWLTASGSEQFATEFAELGHGAFTYVLLEGLAGRADSGDGRVTVNELKAWLESELPEVTQKHKGTPQFPASYGYGQDFPLTMKN